MFRKDQDEIFSEIKKIRASNRPDADVRTEAQVLFTDFLTEYIKNDEDFCRITGIKFETLPFRFIQGTVLEGLVTEAYQCGNCSRQADLAACKLILTDFKRIEIAYIEVPEEERSDCDEHEYEHVYVLLDRTENKDDGKLFDTWAREKIINNPGTDEIAKNIGITKKYSQETTIDIINNPTKQDCDSFIIFLNRFKLLLKENHKKWFKLAKSRFYSSLSEDEVSLFAQQIVDITPDKIYDVIDKWIIAFREKSLKIAAAQKLAEKCVLDSPTNTPSMDSSTAYSKLTIFAHNQSQNENLQQMNTTASPTAIRDSGCKLSSV